MEISQTMLLFRNHLAYYTLDINLDRLKFRETPPHQQ